MNRFLLRNAVLDAMYLCPSVFLSVTSRSSIKTTKHVIWQTTLYGSLRIYGFLMPKILLKFQWGHPQWRRQIHTGLKNL